MPHIDGYSDFLVEFTREKFGYDAEDASHDDAVLKKLQSGEKLSKSKHVKAGLIRETIHNNHEALARMSDD